jgi:hypothetical protein
MGQRLLRITSCFLRGILEDGERNYIVEDGLPADTRIVNAQFDISRRETIFVLESAEWPEVLEGRSLVAWEPNLKVKVTPQLPRELIRFREFF